MKHLKRRACRTVRAAALLCAAVSVAIAQHPAGAEAKTPAPSATFTLGVVDDVLFEISSEADRLEWLSRARGLGSSTVRITADWSQIAPSVLPPGFRASDPRDPHYNWGHLDGVITDATGHGQSVLLLLMKAPEWAQGADRPQSVPSGWWRPNAKAYGAFARAAAVRYSGRFPDPQHPGQMLPRVRYFQAWSEPNLPNFLLPQWVEDSRHHILPASPGIYRPMLNAAYAAIKSVQPRAYVLAAGTAPYGDPPGVNRMSPLVFLREMFCLTPSLRPKRCADPPHFDALDHHPYALTPTAPARIKGDVSVPDLWKIWRVLHAAQRAHHSLPAGAKSLWVTEIEWRTEPPTSATIAAQARYLPLAFYEFWRQGVSHVLWYGLRDPTRAYSGYIYTGSGLFFLDGTPKPSAAAFRFPFVAMRKHGTLITLWGKAPHRGRVLIQAYAQRRWRALFHVQSAGNGVFTRTVHLKRVSQLRAVVGSFASPSWMVR